MNKAAPVLIFDFVPDHEKKGWADWGGFDMKAYNGIWWGYKQIPNGNNLWVIADSPHQFLASITYSNADIIRIDQAINNFKNQKLQSGEVVMMDYSNGGKDQEVVIIKNDDGTPRVWISKKEYDLEKAFFEKINKQFIDHLLWGVPYPERTKEQKFKDHLKFAYVFIGDKKIMTMVHNETKAAYHCDGYTLIEPLQELKYDRFDRWCRLMDL